ncbi:predicted protein [Naegleria gruberi]|uniref:Predicted protein n=1 Tax=Naegleria gruberi TaxID=5762 RepID=D2VNY2_NAEGR|nr:uncharacterized protein NAEGRDRAFT_70659 [Naegleria gruberi]EFC41499.1 predicted protein [Naegleria gruberi]|eukprot:XP_002674243.1 predicted protein [Naegleria gruberi strain NEG-M]
MTSSLTRHRSIALNNSNFIEASLSSLVSSNNNNNNHNGLNSHVIISNAKQKSYSTTSSSSSSSSSSLSVSKPSNQQTILTFIETTKKKRIETEKKEMVKDILDTFSDDPFTSKFLTNIISSKVFAYSTPKKLKDTFQVLLLRKSRKTILSSKFDELPEERQYSLMCKTLSEDLLPFIQEYISEGKFDFLKKDTILQSLFLPTRSMRYISRDVALYLLENNTYMKLNIKRSIVEDAVLSYYRVMEDLSGFTKFVTENQLDMSVLRYGMFIELINKNGDSNSLTTVFEELLNYLLQREELNLTPKEWDIISKSFSLAINHYQLLGELDKAEELFSLSIHSQNLYSKPSNFKTEKDISILKSHIYSSLTTFNSIIKTYLNAGMVEQSYKLVEVAFAELAYLANKKIINAPLVKQSKQFISIINPLLNVLISRGNLQEADKVVTSIFDKSSSLQKSYNRTMNQLFTTSDYSINADRVTFLILIRRHSIDGNITEIVNIMRNMHVFGVSPSNEILQSAIVSLAFNGQSAGVEALLQFLVSEFDYKLTDYAAYAIMKCYVQTGNIQKAERVLEEYSGIGKPIIGMYNVVIGSNLTQLHNYEAACQYFFNAVQQSGLAFAVNQHTFTPFINFFTIAADETALKCINTLQTLANQNPKETAFLKYSQILKTIYEDISKGRKGENNGASVESVVEQAVQKTKSLLSQAKSEIHKEMRK